MYALANGEVMQISDTAQSLHQWMVALRRMFHRQPELAFEEANTARLVMRELDQLGIPYEYGGVGGGVVGRLTASGDAVPTIALRAEMDALPGTEATGLSFSSVIEGKMHACGHDAHMAMILGAAVLLKRDPPPCHVLFVFQPAEERGAGARVIMKSGALKGVRAIFGGHVTHHYRLGEIMVASGVITAQSDRFSIRIRGRGGHGARPHEAVDAVVVTGLLIIALQTLVSREINPIYPSVVTIGTVRAGSAPNVIAETAELDGSIRTTLPEVRNHIHMGIKRMAKALEMLHNAKIEVDIQEGYPPVVNTEEESHIAHLAAEQVVGHAGVVKMDYPSMGSEDFSYYLEKIPGCYIRFGARKSEHEYIPLHSPDFDIHEGVLEVGAKYFAEVVRQAASTYSR